MPASQRTWILLADGSRARILVSDARLTLARPLRDLAHPQSRAKGIDLSAGDRGRTQGPEMDPRKSAMEPNTSPHQVELHRFAVEVVRALEQGRLAGAFERLIVAAPPQFLGLLRDGMTAPLRAMLLADLPKRLTDIPDDDVADRLRAELPPEHA